MSDGVARVIGGACVVALLAVAGLVAYLVVTDHDQSHAHADASLVELADASHVVGQYDDCSDYSGVGYVKNNSCIDYLLLQSPDTETVSTFLKDELDKLHRHNWHLFSPTDFGYHAPVAGRTDLYGHDCLLLGPPKTIPFHMARRDSSPQGISWTALRRRYQDARRRAGPIIGLQLYPGPANDPYHRTC